MFIFSARKAVVFTGFRNFLPPTPENADVITSSTLWPILSHPFALVINNILQICSVQKALLNLYSKQCWLVGNHVLLRD
jgi:hypothetical protein